MQILLGLLLPITGFLFALGITQPLLQLERLYFLEETPSLIQIIHGLFKDGEALLAALVLLFSIVLPALKIIALGLVGVEGRKQHWLRVLSVVNKWSMMDVMLVALVIFAAKTTGLAVAHVQTGLWFYAGATLLSAIAAFLCQRQSE
ncbi:paraquat-inducible protein A [Polycladidibacter stylochi]|uniref:paraquat-inducible protein A n=1 Tax=Polycladidibacter stylochi TaxID=1807766 RepID=UPI00082BB1EE|nr:paraquat-inducible protein A [Pseudovibrio stylochi]